MEFKMERIVFVVLIFPLLVILYKLSEHKSNSLSYNTRQDLNVINNDFKKSLNYYRQRDFPKPTVSWFANHKFNATIPSLQKYRMKPDKGEQRKKITVNDDTHAVFRNTSISTWWRMRSVLWAYQPTDRPTGSPSYRDASRSQHLKIQNWIAISSSVSKKMARRGHK